MKHFKKIVCIALSLSALAVLSCSEDLDNGIDRLNSVNEVKVENGIVMFKNRASYENLMNSLSGQSAEYLDKWEQELDRFKSMRTAFSEMNESDLEGVEVELIDVDKGFFTVTVDKLGVPEIVRTVDSDALATVLNEDGEFKIGDLFYRITYNNVFEFADESLLGRSQKKTISELQEMGLKIYSVSRSISVIGGENLARVGTCNDEYRKRRRFKAELWITNTPPVYSGTGARAKHQRYVFPAWWADSTNEITLDVDGTFTQSGPGPVPVSEDVDFTLTQFNTANIQWVWYECFGVACTFDASARVEVAGRNGANTGGCVIP